MICIFFISAWGASPLAYCIVRLGYLAFVNENNNNKIQIYEKIFQRFKRIYSQSMLWTLFSGDEKIKLFKSHTNSPICCYFVPLFE